MKPDHTENKTVLKDCLAKPASLKNLIQYAEDSIVSKTVIDKKVGSITLFAFDQSQKLSEHISPYDAVVQIVEGKAGITIDNESLELTEGEIIIMPANVPHAVAAESKFRMLLIMIRA